MWIQLVKQHHQEYVMFEYPFELSITNADTARQSFWRLSMAMLMILGH
jgi:hypothetical protein